MWSSPIDFAANNSAWQHPSPRPNPNPYPEVFLLAGDSHTVALSEHGAVYGWGTFRDGSGVMGFSNAERIQLVPVPVYQPPSADAQVVKVVSGPQFQSSSTAGCTRQRGSTSMPDYEG